MPLHDVLDGGGDHGQHEPADEDVEDTGHVAQRQGTLAASSVLLKTDVQPPSKCLYYTPCLHSTVFFLFFFLSLPQVSVYVERFSLLKAHGQSY